MTIRRHAFQPAILPANARTSRYLRHSLPINEFLERHHESDESNECKESEREQEVDSKEVISQLLDAINLNASVINADSLDSFLSDKPRKFRCHYAVKFGSQRVETDSGQNRAKNLRKVFNSPFCHRSLQNAPPVITSKCTTPDGCFVMD